MIPFRGFFMIFKQLGSKKGFTLVEVLVVAGIIAILAGILVPLIFKEIDESKKTRAWADIRAISTAMIVFKKDTGQWPIMTDGCQPSATSLRGEGLEPLNAAAMGFDLTIQEFYNNHLASNAYNCYSGLWKGPYIARVSPDPWGYAYLTNAKDFANPTAPVWILSAGPNGTVETNALSPDVGGDDIGLRIK